MDLLGEAALMLATFLFFWMVLSRWQQMRQKKMPPGPMPLPFIGNLLQLSPENIYRSLMKLSEKYGPVFTIYLGSRPIVVLRGYEAVKEALVDQAEAFSGRGKLAMFDWLFQGYGLPFCTGPRARELRRFSIMTLRNFGMGKRSMEERILEEINFLLDTFRSIQSAPIEPTYFLYRSVSNVISSITFGHRFDYKDPEFTSLQNMMLESIRFTATRWGQIYDMFSGVVHHLPGPHHKALQKLSEMEDFFMKKAKANQETLDPNAPRDFMDCFIVKMQKESEEPNSHFFLKSLVINTIGIFFAGTETISSTLRYGFLILLKYPEVAGKMQKEIDLVIGRNRSPTMKDCSQMPYTEAVICEILRYTSQLPIGVSRHVMWDTQFRGYTIPKGTEVFPLLGSVLKDPNHFERPEAFDPQHFLDENGKLKMNDAFMPFSVGKRACLGQELARMEVFLFFTSILQNFCCESVVPREEIDITPKLIGFVSVAHSYEIRFIPR
ncbi:cytochrome P450 2A4-like [Elgaria multicarinata webbii]|uniref:cytochrome P450 2A4-like n=1 Tax=Elgaria multicarinata webbii TaxID=159646 RepID=UPI002FCD1F5A